MLQAIRDKLHGSVVWVIVSAIILVFLLGAGNYLFNRDPLHKVIAKVYDEEISLDLIDAHYNEMIKQYYAKQKSYEQLTIDPKKMKQEILDELVNTKTTLHGLENSRFKVDDQSVIEVIKNIPELKVNGKFSAEKYKAWLKRRFLTQAQLEKRLQENVLLEQFKNTILFANFYPLAAVEDFIVKRYQVREFKFLTIPTSKFSEQAVDPAAIEQYYAAHAAALVVPETVKLEYLEISTNKLVDQIAAATDQLQQYHQDHLEYYTLPELVQIKQIQVSLAEEKLAEEILAKLAAGEDFSKLAAKYSQDQTSARKGGDVGWLGKGEVDLEFEKVAFALAKPGDLSSIIKTKYGLHIIKLTAKRAPKILKFSDCLEQVTKHYKEEEAQNKLNIMQSALTKAVAVNQDLKELSAQLNLELKVSEPFPNRGTANGIASYSEVVAAAFNTKELHKNSELISLADDHLVIFRVIDRQLAHQKTLSEATLDITKILQQEYGKQQAKALGESLFQQFQSNENNPNLNKICKEHKLKWEAVTANRDDQKYNKEILQAAFTLAIPKKAKTLILANGDLVIVQLVKIQELDLNKMLSKQPNLKVNLQKELTKFTAYLEQKCYEQALYKLAKVKFIDPIDDL